MASPRRVVSAQFVDLRPAPAAPTEPTAAAPAVSYSANTTGAAGSRGRLIVLAIDRESISFGEGQRVMRAAGEFLDTLGPSDQVALVTVPPPGPSADFTTDHQRVRDLLEDASGAGRGGVRPDTMTVSDAIAIASGNLNVMLRMCRNSNLPDCETTVTTEAGAILTDVRRQTMQSVWALEGLLDRLADIEGRKHVVWISEELLTPDNGTELLRVRSLAAAAQTSVHVLLLDKPYLALVSPQERQLEELGLQLMADYTGGTVNRVVSDAGPAFARIEREISGYYLLGVEPLEDDLDGNQHEIDVSVQRSGARVRARREVVHRGRRAAENRGGTAAQPAGVAPRRFRPAAPGRHVPVSGGGQLPRPRARRHRRGARPGRSRGDVRLPAGRRGWRDRLVRRGVGKVRRGGHPPGTVGRAVRLARRRSGAVHAEACGGRGRRPARQPGARARRHRRVGTARRPGATSCSGRCRQAPSPQSALPSKRGLPTVA